ncbi:glycosyltransferase [Alkalicoccobacillus murimartini]|uniref:GTP:adenosylcobinamide-phosphate guanylyltransferase n=1 Tax=Alkalicoccobacillus murimartini TaxID=171685 RepID=A0ABT9YJ24_9BACI|nr:glycosyltransferase [Alkalicoccobacillus murimartini]MDQ0207858.1 GTP:adenosylcobinamide-phosphate guanylyltransferase [Alkalicoccobacillus murimartini]
MKNHVSHRIIFDKEAYLRRLKGVPSIKEQPRSLVPVFRNKQFRLHVIIPAMDEADTISGVLDEVNRLLPDRVIVVVNGSTDQTAHIARQKGATVLHYRTALGNDLGRAIGALHSEADIYLFTDADIVIKAEDYLPFIKDIEGGGDVSINSVDWVTKVPNADMISFARYFINYIQGKVELRAENVLTIPHAFSKKALNTISKEALTSPILANSIAIDKGLKVLVPHDIDVLAVNKLRQNHIAKQGEVLSEAMQRMHGDMLEALDYLFSEHGSTLTFPRHRVVHPIAHHDRLEWQAKSATKRRSVILAITDEDENIDSILSTVKEIDVELVTVVSQKNKEAEEVLRKKSIPFISLSETYSEGVYFYIGSQFAQGDSLLFLPSDVQIEKRQIELFFEKAEEVDVDISINDQLAYLKSIEDMSIIHVGARLLNANVNEHSLSVSSLLTPPFAMNRSVLTKLDQTYLQKPGRAHIQALSNGLKLSTATAVDCTNQSKRKEDKRVADLVDGFYYWIKQHGPRGAFTDGKRQRHLLGSHSMVHTNSATLFEKNMNIPLSEETHTIDLKILE